MIQRKVRQRFKVTRPKQTVVIGLSDPPCSPQPGPPGCSRRPGRAPAPGGCGSSSPSCRSSSPAPSSPCRPAAVPSCLHRRLRPSSPSSRLLHHLLPRVSSPSSRLLLRPTPSSRSWVWPCGSPSSLRAYVFAAAAPSSHPPASSPDSPLLPSLLLSPRSGFCHGYSWTVRVSSPLRRWCVFAPWCPRLAGGQRCSSLSDVGRRCLSASSCPGCHRQRPPCPRSDLRDEESWLSNRCYAGQAVNFHL